MNRQWIPYGLLLVVSLIAGVVIGGGPGALRSSGSQPEAPAIDIPAADASGTSSSLAPNAIPADTTTTPSTSRPASATSTTTSPSISTEAPTTTTTSPAPTTTTTTPAPDLRERDDLNVAVANGVGTEGAAGVAADALEELGYSAPATRDAALFEVTTVFFVEGLDGEAERLAIDAGLDPDSIASIDALPDLLGSGTAGFELVLVLGSDGAASRAGSA